MGKLHMESESFKKAKPLLSKDISYVNYTNFVGL